MPGASGKQELRFLEAPFLPTTTAITGMGAPITAGWGRA